MHTQMGADLVVYACSPWTRSGAVKEQICRNRDFTALWEAVQDFFADAKKATELSRKRTVTEVDEESLALRAQKRNAASPEREFPLTPTYGPRDNQ